MAGSRAPRSAFTLAAWAAAWAASTALSTYAAEAASGVLDMAEVAGALRFERRESGDESGALRFRFCVGLEGADVLNSVWSATAASAMAASWSRLICASGSSNDSVWG